MNHHLYGRDYELGWLHNRVFRSAGNENMPSLTLIYGPKGIGKTALLRAFVRGELLRQKAPTFFFQPEISAGVSGVELFAESIFRSAGVGPARPAGWSMEAARMGEQFAQRLEALRRGAAPTAAAYSERGTITGANSGEMAVVGDPRGHQLSNLCVEVLSSIVQRAVSETGNPMQRLSIVFCFDQFADYAPSVKKWVGSVFIQALMRTDRLPVPKVLLTGNESMEAGGQTDYWELPLSRVDENEVRPLSRSACIKWLVDCGIDPELIDELMERTKGVPGRLCELISDGQMVVAMKEAIAKEELGSAVTVKQRRWLHASAVLDYVDREGLAILLGERESASAFEWLRLQAETDGVTLVDRGGLPQIFLNALLKRRILAESTTRYPDRHSDFKMKVSVQKRLLEKVPAYLHREYLKHLVAIEPFDLEMIEKIYGDDG